MTHEVQRVHHEVISDHVWRRSKALVYTRKLTTSAAGFSLIELLIVLALVVILGGLYWNSNSGSRNRNMQLGCQNNLAKLYVAMTLFGNEHGGSFPMVKSARTAEQALDPLVPTYTSDTSVFLCPSSGDGPLSRGQPLREGKVSYAYYMGRGVTNGQEVLLSDKQVNTESKTAGELVFSLDGKPPGNNHGKNGGNFLFCDGHVEASAAKSTFPLLLSRREVLLNP